MMSFQAFLKKINEDGEVPVNNAGAGNISGIGVGKDGEPGVKKKPPNKKPVLRGIISTPRMGD